nr:hypothetical protein [Caballeronia sp. TF1N1]
MSSLSTWSCLAVLVICIVMLYPYVRIVQRTGYSGWWLITLCIPGVNLIMPWVFAMARWPALDGERRA